MLLVINIKSNILTLHGCIDYKKLTCKHWLSNKSNKSFW